MEFITGDFLLESETARELFHNYAGEEPIFDYHCHLPAKDIAENRRFNNLYEIWLAGDHYKWRMMRANGVPERCCTGDAPDYEKFMAWARTVPYCLRNQLYHWTHLELKRYFDVNDLLNEQTAEKIWNQANEKLQTPELSVRGILKKFKVAAICTTDDPADDLEHHKQIAASDLTTKVYPAFRPDKALQIESPETFNAWADKLAGASGEDTEAFSGFLSALRKRHDFFHEMGCRLSDHGLERCFALEAGEKEAEEVFRAARRGRQARPRQREAYKFFMLKFFGKLDAEKGWTKQLHLGALRNTNSRLFEQLGPDAGCDSIGDFPQAIPLARFLDTLEKENALPKTILYNLNPADNYVLAAMTGNFQDGSIPGKIQFGGGWWFLDQKEGMEWQINALSQIGLLSRFVGMLTDSRSFLSYCRHEYFRRILCNLLGGEMERGLLPRDIKLAGRMVKNIAFSNAKNYFGLETGDWS